MALHTRSLKPIDLLLEHCAELPAVRFRKPVFERLHDKVGAKLARLLLLALVGNQCERPAPRRPG